MAVAHLPFDFGRRHQRGDAVDHDDIDGAAADKRISDFERLLAGVGLRYQEVIDIDAKIFCIGGVKGVLGIDKHRNAALALRIGDRMECEGGFSQDSGPNISMTLPLGKPPTPSARSSESAPVDMTGTSGLEARGSQPHDRSLAVLLLNLAYRLLDRRTLAAIVAAFFRRCTFFRHGLLLFKISFYVIGRAEV